LFSHYRFNVFIQAIYVVVFSIEQYNTVSAQGQSNNTIISPTNVTQANATSANTTKPVNGYVGLPASPLNAVPHVFDDTTLRVNHFCKPNDKIMMIYIPFAK
jgi:hypothetical protein